MQLKDEYITQETFPDGSTVSFRCDSGYTPAGGSAVITCNAGVWSTVLLKCESKYYHLINNLQFYSIQQQSTFTFFSIFRSKKLKYIIF